MLDGSRGWERAMAGKQVSKKVAALMLCGALAGTFVVVVDSAGAAKPTITATGEAGCSGVAKGKVKFSPPLRNVSPFGTKVTVKVNLGNSCSGTTGNPLVTPIGAKVTIEGVVKGTTPCTGGFSLGPNTAEIKWKGQGGKINPTQLHFVDAAGGWFTSPPPHMQSHFPGFSTNAVVTGSYAGNTHGFLQLIYAETEAQLQQGCASKGGMKKLTATGYAGGNDITGTAPTILSTYP
jgi:hypothetical protein